MQTVNGYFDGQNIVFIENTKPKKNQKVIVTLLDDFQESKKAKHYQKYVGKLDRESYDEIVEALKDCEQVDVNEW